jgi:hypothetical protein
MGHHARTLTALLAVLATTLVVASTAAAHPSVVRVETYAGRTDVTNAFVNRMAVDTPGGVAIADRVTDPLNPNPPVASCAATSPAAALVHALGITQVGFRYDPGTGHWTVGSLKGLAPLAVTPPALPAWTWRLYVDQAPMPADEACTTNVPIGSEVLLYQGCGSKPNGCFSGTPLYMRVRDGGPYDIAQQVVPGRGAPVVVRTIGDLGPTGAVVTTDEGRTSTSQATGVLPGEIGTAFTEYGTHAIMASKADGTRPPARLNVCASEGNDGFCGSTRYQPPPEIDYAASPCPTNGHDGFCGTTDTTGPVTHVTNVTQKQKFKKGKGPGQIKGTIDVDPNAVKGVRLRLTRVSSARVAIKAKKKRSSKKAKKSTAVASGAKAKKKAKTRYRTVKRCTAWDDGSALLEPAKCGTRYAKWFDAELNDLRNGFTYSFAMTLPAGTYTLEVEGTDENGFKDLPAVGRNVLTFTVL